MQSSLNDQVVDPRCPKIVFSKEEIKRFYQPWSKALVVKVLEKSFSFLTIKYRLKSLWARTGMIQVSDMSNNFYLVHFANGDDYSTAAFGDPCSLAFTRIGNVIGRTVRVDLATSEGARCRYARVCVEIDLTKPLLGKYMLEDRVFKIEYESLENICFDCGTYGHRSEQCKDISSPQASEAGQVSKMASPMPEVPNSSTEDPATGDWMVVQLHNRRKSVKAAAPKSAPATSSTQILNSQKEDGKRGAKNTTIVQPDGRQTTSAESDLDQVEKLRRILDDATNKFAIIPRGVDKETEKASRPVLEDITNAESSALKTLAPTKPVSIQPQGSSDVVGDLVNVQVVCQNPTFQSISEGLKSQKPKTSSGRKSKPQVPKDTNPIPNLLGQKKRSFKKTSQNQARSTPASSLPAENENEAPNSRKPPDRE
ncbi:hypothetical protein LINPERHAP1_LOCUS31522 [Linum perenne]